MKKINKIIIVLLLLVIITGCSEKKNQAEEQEYTTKLIDRIFIDNDISENANLETTSDQEKGLFKTAETNTNQLTYFYRGNVENNYLSLAGLKWRIIRINEDGSIRIILEEGLDSNTGFNFSNDTINYNNMYYENSDIQTKLNEWYEKALKEYDNVLQEESFCSEFKVTDSYFEQIDGKGTIITSYKPSFRCNNELKLKIGLITIDEAIYAGGFYRATNENFYLYNENYFWTMSPAGYEEKFSTSYEWIVGNNGQINIYDLSDGINYKTTIRPVVNIKNDAVIKSGNGTYNAPYIIVNK